jgi:alpha-L-arabinofuranosidase
MTLFNPKFPALDSIARLSEDGSTLYLAVVNRSEADDVATSIRIGGWSPRSGTEARAYELNGKSKVAANSYGGTQNVNIQERPFPPGGSPFSYRFPAHSVTVLEIPGHRHAESALLVASPK